MPAEHVTARTRRAFRETPAHYLTDEQLLESLLDISPAQAATILERQPLSDMSRHSMRELSETHGLDERRALALAAATAMSQRLRAEPNEPPEQITGPRDAAQVVRKRLEGQIQEELHVITLNTRNQVQEVSVIYRGTVNSSAVRPAEVLRPAVVTNAPAIILAHNHPSGDTRPSPEDVQVTKDIGEAGRMLDIKVLDHVILGKGGQFTSLKEQGLGFE